MRYLIVCLIFCLFWAESFGQNGKGVSRKWQQPLSIQTTLIKSDLKLKLFENDELFCKTIVRTGSERQHKSNEYWTSFCSRDVRGPHFEVKFQQLHQKIIFKPEISPLRYNLIDLVSVFSGVNKFSDNFPSIRGARPDANIVLIDGIRAIEYENAFIPFDEGQSVKIH